MVDRFIVRGRNSDYDIDALVCGTIHDYVWLMQYIACMTIGPKKRNLAGTSKNIKERYLVCVRWNFIREEIINFKNSTKGKDE